MRMGHQTTTPNQALYPTSLPPDPCADPRSRVAGRAAGELVCWVP